MTTEKPNPPNGEYEVMLGHEIPCPCPNNILHWSETIGKWGKSMYPWVADHPSDSLVYRKAWYAVPKSALPKETKVDPYAELKAAHAAGKVIQWRMPKGNWVDLVCANWTALPEQYRIKPDPYAELKAAHAAGKVIQHNNLSVSCDPCWKDQENPNWESPVWRYRIKPEPDGWIPHTPGDEMPCDGAEKVQVKFRDGCVQLMPISANLWQWNNENNIDDIIAWRPVNAAAPEESSATCKNSLKTDPPSLCPSRYERVITPWDIEHCMKSSGNVFVDSRRTNAIEYCLCAKDDFLGNLKKARYCIDSAIKELEASQKNEY